MKRDIKIEWKFLYTKEKVWGMLTNLELIKKWAPAINDFKLIEGFEYEQHQKARGDWDGIIYHKIVNIDPFKKLSYTFQSGPKKGVITMDTVVTFNLISIENGTLVLMEHTGFVGFRNCLTSYILESGWKKQIAKRFNNILSEIN
jgi:uncharacterized protein YndB with AHSA1/START domain